MRVTMKAFGGGGGGYEGFYAGSLDSDGSGV